MTPGLYVVATPIGNLKDITYRAVETLRDVSFIAAEDTRRTMILLNAYDIKKELISYHGHSDERRMERIIERMQAGESCALVSEAGTPGISDPGVRLISNAREANIPVIPIPGASAFVTLLSVAGIPTNGVLFVGFLPPKSGSRRNRLTELCTAEKKVIVLYESVHRITALAADIAAVFPPETPVVIGRELTKQFETIRRFCSKDLLDYSENGSIIKGEFTLIIDNRGKALKSLSEDADNEGEGAVV
ncbi:MAG: 16S rRNA (cytidine(1402)-2'-O)-methyltransferase [Spirochaetota bacterium]